MRLNLSFRCDRKRETQAAVLFDGHDLPLTKTGWMNVALAQNMRAEVLSEHSAFCPFLQRGLPPEVMESL